MSQESWIEGGPQGEVLVEDSRARTRLPLTSSI